MPARHNHNIDFFCKADDALIFEVFDVNTDFFFGAVDVVKDPAFESKLYLSLQKPNTQILIIIIFFNKSKIAVNHLGFPAVALRSDVLLRLKY